jgi:AraC-like DNA-binding protein
VERLDQSTSEDVLNDVLSHLHVRGAVYCRSELRAPWAFSVNRRPTGGFHAITDGKAWLEVEGENRKILVSVGDLVVLPHGHAHIMSDRPESLPTPLDEIIAQNPLEDGIRLKMGGRGPSTVLLCGGFQFEGRSTSPLLRNLPNIIHISGKERRSVNWLRATLRQIDIETKSGQPGAMALIARLSDILFIQAVRAYISSLDGREGNRNNGWLRALRDPQIGAAISFIHQQPEHEWKVASLSSKVGMSRSAFSDKFRALVGVPPLKYVAQWRVHKAIWLLRTSDAKIADIAGRVGYDSEVSLSRAFKRFNDTSPGSYRRQHS